MYLFPHILVPTCTWESGQPFFFDPADSKRADNVCIVWILENKWMIVLSTTTHSMAIGPGAGLTEVVKGPLVA